MTTHTVRPGAETRGGVLTRPGHDLMVFAAVVLGVLGLFNLLDGIAAINRSRVFVGGALYVVGDLSAWGWVMAVLGGLQLLAAFGVMAGNQVARWFGVAVVALNAVGQMFFLAAYPLWSLMIIAVDVITLYALCAYGGRQEA